MRTRNQADTALRGTRPLGVRSHARRARAFEFSHGAGYVTRASLPTLPRIRVSIFKPAVRGRNKTNHRRRRRDSTRVRARRRRRGKAPWQVLPRFFLLRTSPLAATVPLNSHILPVARQRLDHAAEYTPTSPLHRVQRRLAPPLPLSNRCEFPGAVRFVTADVNTRALRTISASVDRLRLLLLRPFRYVRARVVIPST